MRSAERAAGTLPGLAHGLALAGWLVMAVAMMVGFTLLGSGDAGTAPAPQTPLLIAIGCFFVIQMARVVVAGLRWPHRRAALGALLAGIVLWSLGSALLNGTGVAGAKSFPSMDELPFLMAYVAIAAYLVLDRGRRSATTAGVWLDAVILCGGTAVAAGTIVLTLPSHALGSEGVALLVALLYPLLDIALAMVVMAQAVLQVRGWTSRSVLLTSGFLVMAVADAASLTVSAERGRYSFGIVLDLLWGIAFSLIVTGACTTRQALAPDAWRVPSWLLVGAGIASLTFLASLAVAPSSTTTMNTLNRFLAIPAVLTLAAAGARLVLALNEARQATEAYRLSRTDDLTGLPNRRAVMLELDTRLMTPGPLGLMLVDLDGFKEVNDSLGHTAGDSVLKLVAVRMRDAMPSDVLVGRLGGDEFAVVMPEGDPVALVERANALRDALFEPMRVADLEWSLRSSVGVAVREPDDVSSVDVLRRADVALFEVKRTRTGTMLYDVDSDTFTRNRMRLAADLRRGIEAGEIEVWYQPQMDARSRTVVGLEGLVRWRHPVDGIVQPAGLLPVARRAGLMPALSLAVMHQVVADAAAWYRSGLACRVALNVAPSELLSGPLVASLLERADMSALPDSTIVLEVTEDTFLTDPDRARAVLAAVDRHGIGVAIDDYGTGFSSLAYLRDLPVHELKIDRTFVSGVTTDERSELLVQSTAQLAAALGLRTVAEGVEDAATADRLAGIGVDVLQGYFFAAPMPSADVFSWVSRWEDHLSGTGVPRPSAAPISAPAPGGRAAAT